MQSIRRFPLIKEVGESVIPIDLPANGATSEVMAAEQATMQAKSTDGQICAQDIGGDQRRES